MHNIIKHYIYISTYLMQGWIHFNKVCFFENSMTFLPPKETCGWMIFIINPLARIKYIIIIKVKVINLWAWACMVTQIPSFTIQLLACQWYWQQRARFLVLSLSLIYCTTVFPYGAQAVATLNGFLPLSMRWQFTMQVVLFVEVTMQSWIMFRIGVCIRGITNSI